MTKKILFVAAAMILASCSSSLNIMQPHDKVAQGLFEEMEQAYNNQDCNLYHELYEKFSAEKPSSSLREKAYYYAGMCYEKHNIADKAINIYKLASGIYPNNMAFSYRLAIIYYQTGFYENALNNFEAVIHEHYQEKGALAGAARASAGLGRMEQAAKYYTKALSIDFEKDETDFDENSEENLIKELSLCLIDSARYEEAREFIDKGYSINQSAVWHNLSAKSYAAEGNFLKAAEEMSNVLKKENNRNNRLSKAFYNYWAGNIKQAEIAADKELSVNSYDYLASFLKGMCLRSEGNTDIADSYFKISACGEKFIEDLSRKMSSVTLPVKEELCK